MTQNQQVHVERHDGTINWAHALEFGSLTRKASFQRAPFPPALEHAVAGFFCNLAVMSTLFSVCVVSVLSLSLILCCACSFVLGHQPPEGAIMDLTLAHAQVDHIKKITRFRGSKPMHRNFLSFLGGSSCQEVEHRAHLDVCCLRLREVFIGDGDVHLVRFEEDGGFFQRAEKAPRGAVLPALLTVKTYAQSRRTHGKRVARKESRGK